MRGIWLLLEPHGAVECSIYHRAASKPFPYRRLAIWAAMLVTTPGACGLGGGGSASGWADDEDAALGWMSREMRSSSLGVPGGSGIDGPVDSSIPKWQALG